MKTIIALLIVALFPVYIFAAILNVPDDFDSIQDAIGDSQAGDTVLVEPGVYFENIDFGGKEITLTSRYLITNDEGYIASTVIDASRRAAACVVFLNHEIETSILCGFTLQNGSQAYSGVTIGGGGIFCGFDTRPILKNLHIINNQAEVIGGGICCGSNSRPVIENCLIRNNTVYNAHWMGGGGIGIHDGAHPVISDCIITRNSANGGLGGGIVGFNASFDLVNTIIDSNLCDSGGGIFSTEADTMVIRNCQIRYNNSINYGGMQLGPQGSNRGYIDIDYLLISNNYAHTLSSFYIMESSGEISNLTVTCNEGDNEATGALYLCDISIRNSIFYGNELPISITFRQEIDSRISVDYCDVEGGRDGFVIEALEENFEWGENNLDEDPIFASPDKDNFRLFEDSPCIDAGDPDSPRDPDSTRIDMGAFFFDQREEEIILYKPIIPSGLALNPFPNPFNSTTTISYSVSVASLVSLKVFDLSGREVRSLVEGYMEAGNHSVSLSGEGMASGVYIVNLDNSNKKHQMKLILQK